MAQALTWKQLQDIADAQVPAVRKAYLDAIELL
jgi:hypothetical protein